MFTAAKSGMNVLPTKLLLALTAVAALSFAQPAKANLITNPGFETGNFTGWTVVGGSGSIVMGSVDSVSPHSGNFQAALRSGTLTQALVTMASQSYTVDFYLAHTSALIPSNSLTVTWGGTQILTLTNRSAFGYTHYTFTVTASSASTALQFSFFNFLNAPFLLDDVSVNPAGVGVPDGGTTVSLLGCALLGLAAVRRFLMG